MKKVVLLLAIVTVICACSSTKPSSHKAIEDDKTDVLLKWMTGSFSSAEQAALDQDYYNIVLHMYPIWIEREDDHWLYVEQAVFEMQHKPYRQRVYQVVKNGSQYESHVYELPNPETYIGKWRGGTEWDELTPADLSEKKGCAVRMSWNGQYFIGETEKNTCKSGLRGAKYATSEVIISNSGIKSWDRGYDGNDVQVWGAKKGAYIFKPLKDIPD